MCASEYTTTAAESWGDFVDPREFLYDDPTFGYGRETSAYRSERRNGGSGPTVETEADLEFIRSIGRAISEVSCGAIAARQNLLNYTIAEGLTYRVSATRYGQNAELVATVQRWLDAFLDDNDIVGDREREWFDRATVDGETFIGLFASPDYGSSGVSVREIEPEAIITPANKYGVEELAASVGDLPEDAPVDWHFGACTAAGDTQRVHGYHVQWSATNPADFDFMPATRMLHVKNNVRRAMPRGVSDMFPVYKLLKAAENVLNNSALSAAAHASITYIVQHAQETGSTVRGLRDAMAEGTLKIPFTSGSRDANYVRTNRPRAIDIPAGREYKAPPGAERGPHYVEIEKAVLQYTATRWAMPQYMLTGDPSNANMASTATAESPWIRGRLAEQSAWKKRCGAVVWKALRIACDAGNPLLVGVQYSDAMRHLRIGAEAPSIEVRDPTNEAKRLDLLNQRGIVSDVDYAARVGFDLADQRSKGAKEKATFAFTGVPFVDANQPSVSESLRAARAAANTVWEQYG